MTKKEQHKLTDKQQKFVEQYPIDLNATQAAIRAGYSVKTAKDIGCQNLAKLYIQEAIQEQMDKVSEEALITAKDVIKSIIDIRDTAVAKMPLTNKLGEVVAIDMLDKTAALKANELLGKHLVMFTEKKEIEVSMGVTIVDDIKGE